MCDQKQKVNSWYMGFQNWGKKVPHSFFCINSEKVKYSTFLDGFLCGLDVTFKVQAVYKYVSASILYQALSCLLCCISPGT